MRSTAAWNRSVLLLLVAAVIYSHSWIEIWPHWENGNATYTHGTLIAAITIWLIWRTRTTLADVAPIANPRLLPLVLVSSFAWLLAARANIFIGHVVLWPVVAFTILLAGTGARVAAKFAFPLAFLYFGIPVWDYLKPPLQALASVVVGFLTSLAGVPALVEGPHVILPRDTIFIALECSGAHFLSVALAVGALAGEIRGDNLKTRMLIMGVAAALGLIFNWLRILLIVFAYLHPDLKHGMETVGHYTFGWWVFAFDIVAFYFVLRFIPSSTSKTRELPVVQDAARRSEAPIAFPLVVVIALLLPVSTWAVHRTNGHIAAMTRPVAIPGATGPISPDVVWNPNFEGAHWAHRVAYISEGAHVFDAHFTIIESELVRLHDSDVSDLSAHRTHLVDASGRHWLAMHTYFVAGKALTNTRLVQLMTALRSLYGHPRAGVLAVMTLCGTDCDLAAPELEQFLIRAQSAYLAAPGEHESSREIE